MEDDRVLVSNVLNGERQAFRMLIRQHERLVAHMIGRLVGNREEMEELCQDVFLKVYEKIGEFNFRSKLSTWIATIAYRQAINHMKKKKLLFREIPDDDGSSEFFIEPADMETIIQDKDMDRFILSLADKLPPSYKTVLFLYHVDALSYSEITEITGMPAGTVKNYIFRARKLLKDIVMKYLGKEELI